VRIAVLTGGGDVPGLNVCIKAITTRARALGWEVIGFRKGWAGPLNCNPGDPASFTQQTIELTRAFVRKIDRTGGTILHTSRIDPARVRPADMPDFLRAQFAISDDGTADCTDHILDVLDHMRIDALILTGGDGTLRFGARLFKENYKIVSIPKTMDNDVFGTDYCIGFSTAVTRSVDLITSLRSTAGSHERVAVIELFGRLSGETALISGYLADADRVLIAEVPIDAERLCALITEDWQANPSNYAMLVVSEGARLKGDGQDGPMHGPFTGHNKLDGIGDELSALIQQKTGLGTITQRLAYLMRAGVPDALDRMVANSFGTMAVQLLESGRYGRMMSVQDGKYTSVPADTVLHGRKRVDVPALYDSEIYRPRIASVDGKPIFLY